jgi:SAM-dependent methyltransferase
MAGAVEESIDLQQRFYPESRFGGYSDIDGTVVFYSRVNSLLTQESVVVDLGCGRGNYRDDQVQFRRAIRVLKGKCRRVIGLDVDLDAKENPFLDEFLQIEGPDLPLPDATADLCVMDSVLEHIEDPEKIFQECRRIIKPGGYLCIRTPNVFSYVCLASLLVPNRMHASVLSRVQKGRMEQDVFPTLYRCNSRRRVERELKRARFDPCVYTYEAEPSYLSFSRLAYYLGVLHQRHAPRAVRLALFAFARRI